MSWMEQVCRWSLVYAYVVAQTGYEWKFGRSEWLAQCDAYARAIGLPV